MLLLKQLVTKQDEIIVVNDNIFWRGSFIAGVDHENRFVCVVAAPYYPPNAALLHRNTEKYPVRQVHLALQSKHGREWENFYRPPERLRIDVLDEHTFNSVHDLNDALKRLYALFETRNVAGSWEDDFCRTAYLCNPIRGDRVFFREIAVAALNEKRVQASNSCKKILDKNDNSLVALGMAISVLENLNPYKNYQSGNRDFSSERDVAISYS